MPADTIPHALERRAAQSPERVALIGNDGSGEYAPLTYAEVLALSSMVCTRLVADHGQLAGKHVLWLYGTSNPLVAFVLYHAIARAGAVNVPVNPASTAAEVDDLVHRTAAPIVIAAPGAEFGPAAADRLVPLGDLAALRGYADNGLPSLPLPPLRPEAPAVVLFTSGTTGRSKGVVHSHATALAAGAGWADAFELTGSDVYQSMFPVYAGAGLHFSGLACLLAGATYVIDEPRPTRESLARIERYGATVYAAVPSVYRYWLSESWAGLDLSSLRLLDFGGSVMHRSLIEALRDALPGVELVQTYGLTEAGPGGLHLPPRFLDVKLGSIGCIGSGGLQFRVDTASTGEEPPAGDEGDVVGELQLRGSSIMLGYLDDPVSTAAVFDGEWMRTGDLVRRDPDGFVFFVDRLKDLIIRGGFNISSLEVEEVLLQHPGVRQIAVFGLAHEALGEVVAAAIVPEADLDLTALRSFAEERLARVKVPARVVLVDELPVSAAGKVLKSSLRGRTDFVDWRG